VVKRNFFVRCKIRGVHIRVRAPRVPATRAKPSHLKKSLSSPCKSLYRVSLSCHVRTRKGEKRERGEEWKWEAVEKKREREERKRKSMKFSKGRKEERKRDQRAALSRSCIPRSWKTHCLGCTHTDSGGCVASVKYRRSDFVEWACTSKRCSSRAVDSNEPSLSVAERKRERERERERKEHIWSIDRSEMRLSPRNRFHLDLVTLFQGAFQISPLVHSRSQIG